MTLKFYHSYAFFDEVGPSEEKCITSYSASVEAVEPACEFNDGGFAVHRV